ncbi:hypothetical protein G6F24_016304 [Rhizopus arrhizus]|nr:hypothetical protein G6F24_016304 [Rhizopus arrhizus]
MPAFQWQEENRGDVRTQALRAMLQLLTPALLLLGLAAPSGKIMRKVVAAAAIAACAAVPAVQAQEEDNELPAIRVEAAGETEGLGLNAKSGTAKRCVNAAPAR